MLTVDLAGQGYDPTRSHEYHARAVELARSIPGVVDASAASRPFLTGRNPQRTIRPQGSSDETLRARGQLMSYASVMPGYLRFMDVPLAAGRDFAPTDDDTRRPVIIINEALAQRAWPGENALGKTVKLFGSETLVEVVGVVRNAALQDLLGKPEPFAFLPYRQQFHPLTVLHIRTAGNPATLLPTLAKELRTLDPAMPLFNMRTMDDGIYQLLWGPRTGARLMSVFGALALLLAALGVYAIMAHSVSQRNREIGIRIAIGAQARDVLTLIIRRGLLVTAIGLSAGLLLAYVVARHFQSFFVNIEYTDPLTYGVIAFLLAVTAMLACWLPARRAARVDPMTALRTE
jgi:putative ABC transport system permease protein